MNFTHLFAKKSIQGPVADIHGVAGPRLTRTLTVWDLTAMGIAAIIGAGIFSTIGQAASAGGPAVVLLFIFTGLTCGFSALCYAEFASAVPVSGSAYTYAYVAFGEIIAWIIGWDLIIEYAIGNIVVAISWSDYFTQLLAGMNIELPYYWRLDWLSAYRHQGQVAKLLSEGQSLEQMPRLLQESYLAWQTAPQLLGFRIIADLPVLVIVGFITGLVYVGIKESKIASNLMVALKLIVILFVIIVGCFYIQPQNWTPFAPNGFSGVMLGVAAVFFAYIGFDALSTTAEECINPTRDLPRAILLCLVLCTVLYIALALVLTGMVPSAKLAVGDPLAFAFTQVNMDPVWANRISGFIAASAIIAIASVLLIFQMGQPRIWMVMSRDGLIPKRFSTIHPRFHTPSFATIVTGFVVAIPCLFLNFSEVTELSSIGTLFAFVLVCAGVLKLQVMPTEHYQPKFKIPVISARWYITTGFVAIWAVLLDANYNQGALFGIADDGLVRFWQFEHLGLHLYTSLPVYIFMLISTTLVILSWRHRLSLVPVLGLLSCFYLMSQVGHVSWYRFFVWLLVGLGIYALYGNRNSVVQRHLRNSRAA
jgi:basic amino acid/polyamine antiporter, APA family